jgi:hypothetical protein
MGFVHISIEGGSTLPVQKIKFVVVGHVAI